MYVCSGFVKDILDRSYYEAPAVDIHLADKRPHQIGWRLVKYSISDYNTNNVSVLIDGRTRTYCFTEKQIKQIKLLMKDKKRFWVKVEPVSG